MLQKLKELVHLDDESKAIIRRTSGTLAQTITIAGLALTFYSCQAKEIEQAGAGMSFAGFLLEHLIEHFENESARTELDENHRLWVNLNTSNPNIVKVSSSNSWLKIYGHENSKFTTFTTLFNIGSNATGTIITLLNAVTPKDSFRSAAIGCSTISIGLHWLHQKLISHNIQYETALYKKAVKDIVGVQLLNRQAPSQTEIPTYKR